MGYYQNSGLSCSFACKNVPLPSPVFFPERQRSLAGYSPKGGKESDMTERMIRNKTKHWVPWDACCPAWLLSTGREHLAWEGSRGPSHPYGACPPARGDLPPWEVSPAGLVREAHGLCWAGPGWAGGAVDGALVACRWRERPWSSPAPPHISGSFGCPLCVRGQGCWGPRLFCSAGC